MNSLAAQSFPSGMQGHQGMSGRHPDPPAAPPEGVSRELWKRSSDTQWLGEADDTNPNEPPPKAPREEDEEGCLAPPETGGNPNEPAPEAPPEDDEDMAPPEEGARRSGNDDGDDALAPSEFAGGPASPSYGGRSSYGSPARYG